MRSARQRYLLSSNILSEVEAAEFRPGKHHRFGEWEFRGESFTRRSYLERPEDVVKVARVHPDWLVVPYTSPLTRKKAWMAMEPRP
jgi:hypothetical protein